MVGSEQIRAPYSELTWQTFSLAFALHVFVFLAIWGIGWMIPKEEEKKEEEIVPIDLTIVPPWARKTDDPNPDPKPPPPKVKQQRRPKPEAPKEKVKSDIPTQTGEAVEQVKDEPEKKPDPPKKKPDPPKKPEKIDLRKGKQIHKTPPKPPKPVPKLKDTAKLNKVPVQPLPPPPPGVKIPDSVRDFGKGTASEDPLKNVDPKKMLEQGYRWGSKNQLATSEEQRCVSLIAAAIRREWEKESFNWHSGLKPIKLKLQLGAGGKVQAFSVLSSSGDADVDRTARNALTRLKGQVIYGLSTDFLTKYPVLDTLMEPAASR